MARRFAGRRPPDRRPGRSADLCVLNTCTVTATASSKSRQFIRQLRRHNPTAKIVVTGCLAELEAGQSSKTLGVDLVVGNDDKDSLPEILEKRGVLDRPTRMTRSMSGPTASLPGERTRAFLKVQDGCDNKCTFCVVTIARGRGRSRRRRKIISEVRNPGCSGLPRGCPERRPPRLVRPRSRTLARARGSCPSDPRRNRDPTTSPVVPRTVGPRCRGSSSFSATRDCFRTSTFRCRAGATPPWREWRARQPCAALPICRIRSSTVINDVSISTDIMVGLSRGDRRGV